MPVSSCALRPPRHSASVARKLAPGRRASGHRATVQARRASLHWVAAPRAVIGANWAGARPGIRRGGSAAPAFGVALQILLPPAAHLILPASAIAEAARRRDPADRNRLCRSIGMFVALTQVDFMFIRIAADLLVNCHTTYYFLRGKIVNPTLYNQWKHSQTSCKTQITWMTSDETEREHCPHSSRRRPNALPCEHLGN